MHTNARKRSSISLFNVQEENEFISDHKQTVGRLRAQLSTEQQENNEKLVDEAVVLRKKLLEATHQLESSEKELADLGTRLDNQNSELLVYASVYISPIIY